uniref:Uncharacterized protein n=1 Tax=Rhizophora mucronata TaxID=61149 RepID=A0A2P2PVN4_RHIMU
MFSISFAKQYVPSIEKLKFLFFSCGHSSLHLCSHCREAARAT